MHPPYLERSYQRELHQLLQQINSLYFWEENKPCGYLLPQFPHLSNRESCLLGPGEESEL